VLVWNDGQAAEVVDLFASSSCCVDDRVWWSVVSRGLDGMLGVGVC